RLLDTQRDRLFTRVEADDEPSPLHHLAVALRKHRTTARRYHDVLHLRDSFDDFRLDRAKRVLATATEDRAHVLAGLFFDQRVHVERLPVEGSRDRPHEPGLSRAGKADQPDLVICHRVVHHFVRLFLNQRFAPSSVSSSCFISCRHSRYSRSSRGPVVDWNARKFRSVSPSESPPNFSSAAVASTIAIIASTITPAAGTTHTSLRS